MWVRKCQECGHSQQAKKPDSRREVSTAYLNAKCRRCKSSGLDYGKEVEDK